MSAGGGIKIPPFPLFRRNPYNGRLLTFDPGETTGYSIWDDAHLVKHGHLPTGSVKESIKGLNLFLDKHLSPYLDGNRVVIEEYRIYAWHTEDHAWRDIHTLRLIGALETLLTQKGVDYEMCGAGLAKGFATDNKLEAWGYWFRGEKHARDAIRHALYWYAKPPPSSPKSPAKSPTKK